MSRDIWTLAYMDLWEELGHEPTFEQADERSAKMIAELTDILYERYRDEQC